MVTGLQGHRHGGYYFRAAFRRKWEKRPEIAQDATETPPQEALTRKSASEVAALSQRRRWATKASEGRDYAGEH